MTFFESVSTCSNGLITMAMSLFMTFLQSLLYTCLQRKLIQCVVYDTSGIVLVSNKSSKVY